MSPSWRERVTITLSPLQVTMERVARGLRAARTDRKVLDCAARIDERNWQPAIDMLREALAHPNVGPAEATVVLSSHFVRYLLLPWNPGLVTPQEEMAFARARFLQGFGEAARDWALRISPMRPGSASVACAIENSLLQAVTGVIANSPLRLASLQPSLMAICNARARWPAGDAWIAIEEPGRLLLGALRDGEWASLRSRPLNGHAVALAQIMEQEALLLGVPADGAEIYLHRTGNTALGLDGLKVHDWLPSVRPSRAGRAA